MSKLKKTLYWIVILGLLLGIGWFYWQAGRSSSATPPRTESPSRAQKPLPPAVQPQRPAAPTAASQPPAPPPVTSQTVPPQPALRPAVTAAVSNPFPIPAPSPDTYPRPAQDMLEAQIALARQGISCGSQDGLIGPQTRAALRAFQQKEGLPVSGEWDSITRERLVLAGPAFSTYTVTTDDLARLQPLSSTWLGKSQQGALEYETVLELVAEKGQSHPNLVRRLNPSVDWSRITAGTSVRLPDVTGPTQRVKAAFIVIRLSEKILEAFDANTNLLAHFPCSIARHVEKRPAGELHVMAIVPNPNYTFDPEVFPESIEGRQLGRKLMLPPGPNNPVGVAWIGLDKPGYGIHGTPLPEQVGRTESHGCFRLANWNAERLLQLVWMSAPVYVEP